MAASNRLVVILRYRERREIVNSNLRPCQALRAIIRYLQGAQETLLCSQTIEVDHNQLYIDQLCSSAILQAGNISDYRASVTLSTDIVSEENAEFHKYNTAQL